MSAQSGSKQVDEFDMLAQSRKTGDVDLLQNTKSKPADFDEMEAWLVVSFFLCLNQTISRTNIF